MNNYWFEHWEKGELVGIEFIAAYSVSQAVSILSDEFKGVFKLESKQTPQQRQQENLKELARVEGNI